MRKRNIWITRALGLLLIFLSIGVAQWAVPVVLFTLWGMEFTGAGVIAMLGLAIIIGPHMGDVIKWVDRLSRAGSRLLLARAGVNYDASLQDKMKTKKGPAGEDSGAAPPGG